MMKQLILWLACALALQKLSRGTLFQVRGTAKTQAQCGMAQQRLAALTASKPPKVSVLPPNQVYNAPTGDIAYNYYYSYPTYRSTSTTWTGSGYTTVDTWDGNANIG